MARPPWPGLLPPALLLPIQAAQGTKRLLGWVAGVLALQGNIRRGETSVSNNSLYAYNKLAPQREERGLAGREDADLDRPGGSQRLASSEMAAYTCQDPPPTLTHKTCHQCLRTF